MFKLSTNEKGELALSGSLTAFYVDRIRKELDGRQDSYCIDIGGLRHISSAGLGLLVSLQEGLKEHGASFTLVNPSAHIRELIRLTGLDQSFPMMERKASES